jgi:glycosyltransferase involved in cell wall biosynthesis
LLDEKFDIVQVEHSYAFEPLSRSLARSGAAFVLTEHNVESDVVQAQYHRLPRLLRPLGALDTLRCRHWERDVIRRAACVVAVAAPDEPRFAAMGAQSTVLVVNAIDVGAYAEVLPDPEPRLGLFLGNYEYTPNTDAVAWLCDEILPHVWRQEPDFRLAVHGHAMPANWRARWPDPRILFGGYVDSIPALHARASLFVAPLRFGGGSKLKVMEAMASSLPVVATPEAMSGIAVAEGEGFVPGRNAEQLAAGIVRCLREPDAAAAMGVRARAHVAGHHDWAASARRLEQTWHRVLRESESPVHA